MRQRYWTKFNDYLHSSGSPLETYRPSGKNWIKIRHTNPFKRHGAHLAATALSRPHTIAAHVVLEDEDSLNLLDRLLAQKQDIERDVGNMLIWERKEQNAKSRRIYVETAASFEDEADWRRQFEWLRSRLERLHLVFHPLVV